MAEGTSSSIEPGRLAPRPVGGYPVGAVLLSAIGACLLELEGVYLSLLGGSTPLTGGLVPASATGTSPEVLGVLALVEATVVLALSFLVYTSPGTHLFVGVAGLTIALLSLYSGGGFLIGAFLIYVGGVVTIYHRPGRRPRPAPPIAPEEVEDDPVVEADLLASAGRGPPSADDPPES